MEEKVGWRARREGERVARSGIAGGGGGKRAGERRQAKGRRRDEWKRRCLDGIYCSRRKYSKRVASTLLDNRKWKPAPRWFI